MKSLLGWEINGIFTAKQKNLSLKYSFGRNPFKDRNQPPNSQNYVHNKVKNSSYPKSAILFRLVVGLTVFSCFSLCYCDWQWTGSIFQRVIFSMFLTNTFCTILHEPFHCESLKGIDTNKRAMLLEIKCYKLCPSEQLWILVSRICTY